jgi:hypothetical protein
MSSIVGVGSSPPEIDASRIERRFLSIDASADRFTLAAQRSRGGARDA